MTTLPKPLTWNTSDPASARPDHVGPIPPAVDHSRELIAACKAASVFLSRMRVPQTTTEAALQIMQGGAVLDQLNAAIAKAMGR